MRRLVMVCTMAAFVGTGSAHSASIYTLSPKMRDDAQCMYAVLRKVHGIDQVKLGAFESQGWVYPYLEYRAAPAPDGYRLIVRYEAGQSCTNVADEDGTEDFQCVPHRGAYGFTAALSGLYAEGTEPYDGGTPTIEKRWRAECRVDAGTLFI